MFPPKLQRGDDREISLCILFRLSLPIDSLDLRPAEDWGSFIFGGFAL